MSEKKKVGLKLIQDVSPSEQPNNTYRYALNTITPKNNLTSLGNEKGNQFNGITFNDVIAGSIEIDRYKHVVFLEDGSINVVDLSNDTLTLHCQLDFNFSRAYPITGFHRVVRGCEDVVYFFDGINTDKYVNLSRPSKQQTGGTFDITKFEFNPDVQHSTINRQVLTSGGNMRYGNYNFAIEWLTNNEDTIFVTPVDINYTPIIQSLNEGGGLNLDTNLAEIGGKPNSRQSIKLNISNVPEDASLARIIVFRTTTSDGIVTDAHVIGNLIQVSGQDFTYTYTGFSEINGDYYVDKNNYLKVNVVYESSLNALQVNNRSLRYNLKESVRDISNYQQFASKICCKYVATSVSLNDPNIYYLNQTLLGGEIILPCISYVHRDGTTSNAFPLIGRSKQAFDAVLITDPVGGTQVERWKYEDTTVLDPIPIDGYTQSGQFGYYKSDQLYQNPPNYCKEDSYWGVDCDGNILDNTNVRLFVVPDRKNVPHYDDNNIYPIGIWFDESTIEYPNEDIVGHYFSLQIVDQSNISAKGIGVLGDILNYNNQQLISASLIKDINTGEIIRFHSGEFHINENYVSGDYINTEGYWIYSVEEDDETFKKLFASGLPYDQIHIWNETITPDSYNPYSGSPIKVNSSTKINSLSEVNGLSNGNLTIDQLVIDADNIPTDPEKTLRYISLKNNINPIPNIWNLRTRRITNVGENVSFRGNNFISELVLDSIKRFDIEGGETLETILKIIKFGPYAFFIDVEGKDLDAYTEIIKGFYTESKVNCYTRFNGLGCNTNFQHSNVDFDYFLDKMIEPYENNNKLRGQFCKFFPGYNKDYSRISDFNQDLSIRLTYDFCSECTGIYPTRIIFSQNAFDNDLVDNMRVFLPNDFIDLPSDTGAIIAVDYKDNRLIVRTERSCYFLVPNNQELQVSETTVNIGTGDFLSIPAQELNTIKQGYGGQQHKLDSINLKEGLFWSDRERGEIYKVGGDFDEVSERDIYSWFNKYLSQNPDNHLIFTYDKEYKRMLMTKLNEWTISYCFRTGGWKSWHSYIPNWYLPSIDTFFSVYDNQLWKHNSTNYHKFYDFEFDHTIEFTVTNPNTFQTYSAYWFSNTFDIAENDALEITYDKLLAYNSKQTTGNLKIVLDGHSNIFYEPGEINLVITDRNYKVSPISDRAVSNVIWDYDISAIKQGNNQGWVDKLPISSDVPIVEQGEFRDKWISIRLSFSSKPNSIVFHWNKTYDLLSVS